MANRKTNKGAAGPHLTKAGGKMPKKLQHPPALSKRGGGTAGRIY